MGTKEVAINKCWGGFGFSLEAQMELFKRGSKFLQAMPAEKYFGSGLKRIEKELTRWRKWKAGEKKDAFLVIFTEDEKHVITHEYIYDDNSHREDPILIELIKEWGSERVSGDCAELEIVTIPDNINYYIDDYDGMESIHENHNSWG